MNILDLLKHVSEANVKDYTIYECEELEYPDICYLDGRLYFFYEEELSELKTHEIIYLINSNITYKEVKQ